jgi:alpha-tubulin suppressor-like RCC1 family protein
VDVVELDGVVGLAAAGNLIEHGHTCAVREEGSVWCWGANQTGQLGDGTQIARSRPVMALGVADAVQVVTASLEGYGGHTCALRADGVVLCWGSNFHGQLGDPNLAARLTPGPVSL